MWVESSTPIPPRRRPAYASYLSQDFERALELLHDITFHSTFPERELEKEKEVIIDEINSYKDNPSELIIDDFEELVFAGDPMGRNILGTPERLARSEERRVGKECRSWWSA